MRALLRQSRRFVFLVSLITLCATLFVGSGFSHALPNAGGALRLTMPSFVTVAHAQSSTPAASIANEAGISAYFQQPDGINLSSVRGLFRTIEADEEAYIIGSMQVRDYDEWYDVHVYVNTDGWVLAYYLKDDPASKIIDTRAYDGVSVATTLEVVLDKVSAAVGRSGAAGNSFYDFRYPNATHLMLIGGRKTDGERTIQVTLPGAFTYYERSWRVSTQNGCCGNRVSLNGADLQNGDKGGWIGLLTDTQLATDRTHEFAMSNGYTSYVVGFLALVYQEGN